jgi:hypothetical protein
MKDQKATIDPETVLITLDQLSQTVEVLNNSIIRLQRYVQTHLTQQLQSNQASTECGAKLSTTRKHALH